MNQKSIKVTEAVKKYGISDFSIKKLIKTGKMPSAKKTNQGYIFLEDDLIDAAALGSYIVIDDVAAELGLNNSQVTYLIKKGFLEGAKKFNNKWRNARDSLDRYIDLKKQTEKLLTTEQVAKKLEVSRNYVNQLIVYGKLIPELKFQWVWYIAEAELERYEMTFIDKNKYMTVEETAKLLSKSKDQVRRLNRKGVLDFVEYKRMWYVSVESIEEHKILLSIDTIEGLFKYYFGKLKIPDDLQQTLSRKSVV